MATRFGLDVQDGRGRGDELLLLGHMGVLGSNREVRSFGVWCS